jgi:hypothetical protein
LERLEVREAIALGKTRPVIIISCDYACRGQETILAAPIRSKPPPFPCPGLIKIESLKKHGTLKGYIRLDLIFVFERAKIGARVLHHFTDREDIDTINSTLKAVSAFLEAAAFS